MNKTEIQLIVLATGISLLFSCASTKAPVVPETEVVLGKLVGTWKSENGKSYERWTQNADGSYHSSVYKLKEKDTVFMEQADIFRENGKWIFENIVEGQNEGKKTRFTSGNISEKSIQFTNPQHDFPTEIHYTLPDNEHINAFIVGKNKQGKLDTIPFNYSRIR